MLWTVPVLVFLATPATQTTFQILLDSARCTQHEVTQGSQLDCTYSAGKTFRLTIAGVGSPEAAIIFERSDYDGDYHGRFGLSHKCVMVAPRRSFDDLAFISPRSGRVFKRWEECDGH